MAKRVLEQRWPWVLSGSLGVVLLLLTFVDPGPPGPGDWDQRPLGSPSEIAALKERSDLNVLFILVDTLRADHMGSYGYERETSPLLDYLANTGVRFERHLAQSSWTKSSMASLWTGLYPARTGITRYDDVIPAEARMAAEVFREAGFQTVGLYRNGWVAPTFGFDQGFEVYQRPTASRLPPQVRIENPTLTDRTTDAGVSEAATEFLRISGHERWFLYVHLMDLHEYIYDAESALFGSSYRDNYDNSMRWTDGTIQILLQTLTELGVVENTLIVVASDHGEAFLERGFEGHARRVYRETTEVPFLISLPFRLEPGVVVETRSRNVDIWPTILDLLGLAPLEDVDGRSRLPDILASASGEAPEAATRTAIADLDQNWSQRDRGPLPTIAVVEDSYRYVRVEHTAPEGSERTRSEKLFDARDDPREVRDRAEEEPETLARLRAVADDYYAMKPTWGEAPTRELSELELNLLRALGYKLPSP